MNEVTADQIQPIASARRADIVFDQLRSRILSGAFPPASRLPNERELALALKVNRASVREALKRLEFLELIEVRHGQGSFVCEWSASSALQLIEALMRDRTTVTADLLRQILEFRRDMSRRVVELAAVNRTPAQLQRARELVQREERSAGDPAEALEIDIAMNSLLGEATGNLIYRMLVNLFAKLIAELGPLYFNKGRDDERSLDTHRRLLDALVQSDPAAARTILDTMLDYSERAIMAEAERLEAEGLIGPRSAEVAS